MRFLILLALLFSLFPATASPDSSPAWKEAMTAYKATDYKRALEGFKKIAEDEKQISAALCHNIANCEYKLGESAGTPGASEESLTHQAAASIWYRRALALDPWLPEAQQNLRFLRRVLGFQRFESHGLVKFASWFPRRQWIAVCQGAIWGAVIMIVWLVWAPPRRGRRWPLVTLLCLSIALIITTALGLLGKVMDGTPFAKRIISVQPKDAWARTAPAEAAGTVLSLPPGSELFPIKKEGYWIYCDMPGGTNGDPLRGWVRESTTEPLWPWNATLAD
ncbi:MAG TPA: hypothetical protein VG796_26685 [Verrucomicrobiales bacterium]|nr:hypothetical protein [Verrucomicrobiales bacterium]